MDLQNIELELKKRLNSPYRWERKESDEWDRATQIIYKITDFETLLSELDELELEEKIKNYGINKWFNFWTAKAVEKVFTENQNIMPNTNQYGKLLNFEINGVKFDHKVFVFPKHFNQSFEYAKQNKPELIQWFFDNQNQDGRKHLKNRLFIVLFDSVDRRHWKLKAEVSLLNETVTQYLENFDSDSLVTLNIDGNQILSDVIWVEKN